MIQLTPLEKTVAGKELIRMGFGDGIEKGELIGKIHTTQRFLRLPLTPKEKLLKHGIRKLKIILEKLETELKAW